ncbi:MAG: class I SAM-dependent methyltransferase [Candidatus Pacebacteria bacterium]|nr:class I SAM-dependent methyltransferase [Candidatus Paceibacterota bacterium]
MIVDKWNEYDKIGIGVGSYTVTSELKKYIKGRVLEFGCGHGKLMNLLNEADEKFGIDLSSSAIGYAKKQNPKAHLFVRDVGKTEFPNDYFDAVYSIEVIEHISNPEIMLSEMKRVLKPGGYAFIQTPNYPIKRLYDLIYRLRGQRDNFKDDYTHVYKFSYRSLKMISEKYFTIVDVFSRNILGENIIPFIKKIRLQKTRSSLLLGQKTVIVLRKDII